MTDNRFVRVVTFEKDGTFFAQCLEHDICAHAADEETLKTRFAALFNFERNLSIERNGAPFAGIDEAPKEFHEMWQSCIEESEIEALTVSGANVSMARCA